MLRQRLRPGDEDGDPEDPEEGKTKKSSAGSKKGAYLTVNMLYGDWCWYETWGFHGNWSC
jgi:hypothetical protein